MFQYTIKRLLIMIPTFFVVSLVIFLVLNTAPGKPGQANVQGVQNASDSANQNEAYRIFKEQFNLDKPILLNTRFLLDKEDVESNLKTVVDGLFADIAEDKKPTPSEITEAQNELEDWGKYIVPYLHDIAQNHPNKDFQWLATERLTVNAKRKLTGEFSATSLPPEVQKLNREIDLENTLLSQWRYGRDADDAKRTEVQKKWAKWYDEHQGRYEYGVTDTVGIFFFDTRFAKYWGNLLRLDLGISNLDRRPIVGKIISKLKYSLTLSFGTVIFIYLLAVPLGIFSAVRQNTVADQVLTVVLFMLYSLPSFFVGVLLLQLLAIGPDFHLWPSMPPDELQAQAGIMVSEFGLTFGRGIVVIVSLAYVAWSFSRIIKDPSQQTAGKIAVKGLVALLIFIATSLVVQLFLFGSVNMFPTGGFESPGASENMTTLSYLVDIGHHLVLPIFCLTYGGLAALSRYARSGLLDVIRADYIRTARAKGLTEPVVIIKHAVRNGMIPILTLLGSLLPTLIGGSVVIEVIFNIPGMGLYLFESITLRDYNAVMGVFLCQSLLTLLGLLLSDISYALVDPRISFK